MIYFYRLLYMFQSISATFSQAPNCLLVQYKNKMTKYSTIKIQKQKTEKILPFYTIIRSCNATSSSSPYNHSILSFVRAMLQVHLPQLCYSQNLDVVVVQLHEQALKQQGQLSQARDVVPPTWPLLLLQILILSHPATMDW